MAGEHRKSTKAELALAVAHGISPARWARTNELTKMTAYRWAKEPKVREAIESYRRRALDRAIGQMATRATWAVNGITKLADSAESESVRLSALRAILREMMAVSQFSGLEVRMAEVEE